MAIRELVENRKQISDDAEFLVSSRTAGELQVLVRYGDEVKMSEELRSALEQVAKELERSDTQIASGGASVMRKVDTHCKPNIQCGSIFICGGFCSPNIQK